MFCMSCGEQNSDEAKFCKKCGAELKKSEKQPAQQASPAPAPVATPATQPPATAQQVVSQSAVATPKSDNIDEKQYVASAFGSGWADLSNSKGWFVRSLLLALCSLVPVLRWVVGGFSAQWGKEICLGINRRLPQSIFEGNSFVTGAKIWVVNFLYGLIVFISFFVLLMVPVLGPILFVLLVVAYSLISPLLNFQVALSGKISAGFSGIGRGFKLITKKPIKTLASTLAPSFIVNSIVELCASIFVSIAFLMISGVAMNSVSKLFFGYASGSSSSSMANSLASDVLGILTSSMLILFILWFAFLLAGAISNIWVYRSLGHLVAREAPEWLKEPGLVDLSGVNTSNGAVEPYVPLKSL